MHALCCRLVPKFGLPKFLHHLRGGKLRFCRIEQLFELRGGHLRVELGYFGVRVLRGRNLLVVDGS